jgi:hypothetical protein
MSTQQQEQPYDRKDMKIQALKERLAEITVMYEDRDADRRIALTEAGFRIEQLEKEVAEANAPGIEEAELTTVPD